MNLTLVVTIGEAFYIGKIKEIPEVLTQVTTVAETRENILDALELYLEMMQEEKEESELVLEELMPLYNVG